MFQTGKTTIANKVFALGTAGGQASTNPGMPSEFIPFQSSRALKQTVALGSVEEWTLYNMNPIRHPFHIHVNPFQVVKINGAANRSLLGRYDRTPEQRIADQSNVGNVSARAFGISREPT